MIEVFNSTNIFDLMYDYTQRHKCCLLYFKNEALEKCDDQQLVNKVYSFYEEFLPDDMLLIIKAKNDNIIEFKSEDTAKMNAVSWFPTRNYVESDEYYFKCYVIDQTGYISYEN